MPELGLMLVEKSSGFHDIDAGQSLSEAFTRIASAARERQQIPVIAQDVRGSEINGKLYQLAIIGITLIFEPRGGGSQVFAEETQSPNGDLDQVRSDFREAVNDLFVSQHRPVFINDGLAEESDKCPPLSGTANRCRGR